MGNNVQQEFESLIKTLTTEISKEVLIEDLKSIRESYQNTHKDYAKVYQDYTREVGTMKNQLLDFGKYSKVALKHTDELIVLNQNTTTTIRKLDEALKTVKVNQEAVFNLIFQQNENLFERYKDKVSKLNQDEEQRLIKAIQSELLEAETRVSSLNSDIKKMLLETEYNKQKVLEEILDTNEKLAQSYQNKIKAFNDKETVSFFKSLDSFISDKMKNREIKVDKILDTLNMETNKQIQVQREDITKINNTVNWIKREQEKMMKSNEDTQLEFQIFLEELMNQFLVEQKSTLETIYDEVNTILSVQYSKFGEINQKTEKELNRLSEEMKSLESEMKKNSMSQILWMMTMTGILIFFITFISR